MRKTTSFFSTGGGGIHQSYFTKIFSFFLLLHQVLALANKFSTKDGENYYSSMRQTLVEQKTNFVRILGNASPVIDGLLKVVSSSVALSPTAQVVLGMASIATVSF